MKGRKAKPTHLRLAASGGVPGARDGVSHRRTNAEEPEAKGDLFAPPDWMTPGQKLGWAYAIEHAPRGLLRKLDRSLLTVWVVAEDMHAEASQKVQQYGMVVKTPRQGLPMQSPYLPIMNKQAEVMMRAAAQLGFDPTSRSRITVGSGAQKETNRFSKHAARRA